MSVPFLRAVLALCTVGITLFTQLSLAATPTPQIPIPPAPALPSVATYVLMDYDSGQIIAAKGENLHRAPASLTKLMTAYLTYQAMGNGSLRPDEPVNVSNTAWKTGGSRMFIQPGLPVTVDQLLHGLLIDSGNDAAVALAETVGGSQSGFVTLMNDAARRLQLDNTHYSNVNGLPDSGLYTTALDVAKLSRALIHQYPQVLDITKQKSYTYNKITQRSWNPVLFRDPSVDGLKTGLTDESGYCIDATALRNGRRLIAVVMGGPSWPGSTNAVESLLNYGYRFFEDHELYKAMTKVGEIHDPMLSPMRIPVAVASKVIVTVPRGRLDELQTRLVWKPAGPLPVAKGGVVGEMIISLHGQTLQTVPLVSMVAVDRAGWLTRQWHHLQNAL
ncbi:MAG: D-alanyl-D-alanine carboxypeptidase family protein [Acidithiobacillus sp.]